jgi:acetyl esterase/lipase
LPAGRKTTTTKVIIYIHGGGWSGGDKTEMTPYVDTLKRMPDWAVFNINYRLATGAPNLFPTQEMDVKRLSNSFIPKEVNMASATNLFY